MRQLKTIYRAMPVPLAFQLRMGTASGNSPAGCVSWNLLPPKKDTKSKNRAAVKTSRSLVSPINSMRNGIGPVKGSRIGLCLIERALRMFAVLPGNGRVVDLAQRLTSRSINVTEKRSYKIRQHHEQPSTIAAL